MISQRSIQDVLNAAQVEEVVGEFVNLKRRGVNRIGLCPFHDEKTPSFTVSPAKNIYKCFGCGKGGNSAQFLMESEKMSFVESIRYLAAKYNIKLEESQVNKEEYEEEKKHRDSLFIVNDYAEKYFLQQLLEEKEGRDIGLSYFRERGYRENIIRKFGLGYAPAKRDHFTATAALKQYKSEYLEELGLTTKRGMDFFNERVMFTIHNLSGKPIAFAGRILKVNKKSPKYLNSPESEVYNKRKILYGMYQAKTAIRKEDNCILVEGYTDVISLSQYGIENVVASSGTALTSEQLRLVKRFTDNITILYDGDSAGIKAAMKGMDLALEAELNPKIVLLPAEDDPDSFIKREGYEKSKAYLKENAKDFILFKLDRSLEESKNDPIKKSEMIRDIIQSISKIRDSIKRSAYIQQCGNLLGMDEKILVKESNKIIREDIRRKKIQKERSKERESVAGKLAPDVPFPDSNTYEGIEEESYYERQEKPTHKQKKFDSQDVYQEKDLVRIIISHGANELEDEEGTIRVAEFVYSQIVDVIEYFDNPLYKEIILETVQRVEEGKSIGTSFYTNHPNEEIQRIAIDLLSTPHTYAGWEKKSIFLQTQDKPENNYFSDTEQAIRRFKFRKCKRMIELLKVKINKAQADGNLTEVSHLLKAYQKLLEEKAKFAEKTGLVIG